MTNQKLAALVTEAVELDRLITEKKEELKELKSQLVVEATSRKEEHVQTEGEGSSWTATGTDGCICRVTFPAPSLKSKVDGEGKPFEKIKAAAGTLFARLFLPSVVYKPVQNFRSEAESLLGKKAKKLIKLVESESTPKVSFETKEVA